MAEIALRPEHSAEVGVTQVADARTAFDVATQYVEITLLVDVTVRIDEVDRRGVGRIRIVGRTRRNREVADEVDDQVVGAADDCLRLCRHQRIVAIEGEGVAEIARRSDLRQRVIVHEHEFKIRLDRRRDFIVREGAGDVTLVGALEIVVRVEVEQRPAGGQRPVRTEGEEGRRSVRHRRR